MPDPCGGIGGALYATILCEAIDMFVEISLTQLLPLVTCETELIILYVVFDNEKINSVTSGLVASSEVGNGVIVLAESTTLGHL